LDCREPYVESVVAGFVQDELTQYVFIKVQYVGAVLEGQAGIRAVEPSQHLFTVLRVLEIMERAQNHTPREFLVAVDTF